MFCNPSQFYYSPSPVLSPVMSHYYHHPYPVRHNSLVPSTPEYDLIHYDEDPSDHPEEEEDEDEVFAYKGRPHLDLSQQEAFERRILAKKQAQRRQAEQEAKALAASTAAAAAAALEERKHREKVAKMQEQRRQAQLQKQKAIQEEQERQEAERMAAEALAYHQHCLMRLRQQKQQQAARSRLEQQQKQEQQRQLQYFRQQEFLQAQQKQAYEAQQRRAALQQQKSQQQLKPEQHRSLPKDHNQNRTQSEYYSLEDLLRHMFGFDSTPDTSKPTSNPNPDSNNVDISKPVLALASTSDPSQEKAEPEPVPTSEPAQNPTLEDQDIPTFVQDAPEPVSAISKDQDSADPNRQGVDNPRIPSPSLEKHYQTHLDRRNALSNLSKLWQEWEKRKEEFVWPKNQELVFQPSPPSSETSTEDLMNEESSATINEVKDNTPTAIQPTTDSTATNHAASDEEDAHDEDETISDSEMFEPENSDQQQSTLEDTQHPRLVVPKLAYSSQNSPFLAYEDYLVNLLSRIDEIESRGDVVVKSKRKELVKKVEGELKKLDQTKEERWLESLKMSEKEDLPSSSSVEENSSSMEQDEVAQSTRDLPASNDATVTDPVQKLEKTTEEAEMVDSNPSQVPQEGNHSTSHTTARIGPPDEVQDSQDQLNITNGSASVPPSDPTSPKSEAKPFGTDPEKDGYVIVS